MILVSHFNAIDEKIIRRAVNSANTELDDKVFVFNKTARNPKNTKEVVKGKCMVLSNKQYDSKLFWKNVKKSFKQNIENKESNKTIVKITT